MAKKKAKKKQLPHLGNKVWSVDVKYEDCKEIVRKLKSKQKEEKRTIKDYQRLIKLTNEACEIRIKILNELIQTANERILLYGAKILSYTPK